MIIPYVTPLHSVNNAPVVDQEALERIIFRAHRDLSESPAGDKIKTGAFLLGYTGAFWQFHFDDYVRNSSLAACMEIGAKLHNKLGNKIIFCLGTIHPSAHIVIEMVKTVRKAAETYGFGKQFTVVVAPRYSLSSDQDVFLLYSQVCGELKGTEIRIAIYNNPGMQGGFCSDDRNLSTACLEQIIRFDESHAHRLAFVKDSSGEMLERYAEIVAGAGADVPVLQGNIPAAFDKAMFGRHGTIPSDAQVFPAVFAELMLVLFGQIKINAVANYAEKYETAETWRRFNRDLALSDQMKVGYVFRQLGYIQNCVAGEAPLNSSQEKHLNEWFVRYRHYLPGAMTR